MKRNLVIIMLVLAMLMAYAAEQMNRKAIYDRVIVKMSSDIVTLEEAGIFADEIYKETGSKKDAAMYWSSVVEGL